MNVLNQNTSSMKFGLNSFMSSTLGTKFGNKNDSNSYYSKKGEPTYLEDMDKDSDGIVTFDEFREYCKDNDISAKDMKNMLQARQDYLMAKDSEKTDEEQDKPKVKEEFKTGILDLIYAKDGDQKYNPEQDSNGDSIVSYAEYLRYCEQNAKTEAKNSDTRVMEDGKNRFMTVSFGHASNVYNKAISEIPKGRVEGKA